MADDSELPTQILSGAPTPPRGGGAATLDPHEPRLDEGGPGGGIPPVPPTGYGGDGGGDGWDGDDDGGNDRKVAILAAIVGILVVVVLFLILQPGDDNAPAPTATPTPTATAEATPTPTEAAEATPTATPEATPTATPDAPSGGATIDDAAGPTLDGGSVTKFKATQGGTVSFQVKNDADVAQEVHVHGYDKSFDVQPGETRTISFPASITGIFEIEFEQTGTQIGELTVEP